MVAWHNNIRIYPEIRDTDQEGNLNI